MEQTGDPGIDIQKKTKDSSARSEEKYRAVFESSHLGICFLNAQGIIEDCNERLAQIAGSSVERLIGFNTIAQTGNEALSTTIQKALAGEAGVFEGEYTSVTGGKTTILHVTAKSADSDCPPTSVILTAEDITERKRTQQLLTESEENYKRIVETANEGICAIDANLHMTLVNQKMAQMLGYSVEEMVGQLAANFIFEEDLPDVRRRIEERRRGDAGRYEQRLRRKDGSTCWVATSGAPLKEDEGRFAGSFAMFADINESRKAREALRASEERYRLVVENAHEAIVVLQDAKVVFANARIQELSGWTVEEVLSRSMLDFIHPDDLEMIADRHLRRLSGEDVPSSYTARFVDKSGNIKWLELNLVVFRWQGRPAVLVFLNDISERKKAQDDLRSGMEKYRLLAENIADVIWTTDMNLNVTYMSPSAERVWGYSMDEAMNLRLEQMLTPESYEKGVSYFAEMMVAEASERESPPQRLDTRAATAPQGWLPHLGRGETGLHPQRQRPAHRPAGYYQRHRRTQESRRSTAAIGGKIPRPGGIFTGCHRVPGFPGTYLRLQSSDVRTHGLP